MANSWNRFTIMHGNKKVASVRRDGSCSIYSKRLFPHSLYLEETNGEDLDTRLNNLENFYHWCASRVLTLDRKYAKEILNSLGKKQAVTDRERADIAISYHCLSLTDIYWVKGYREDVSFDDINLFSHSLSDAFVDVSLRGRQLTVQNAELLSEQDVAGDVATVGVAPKAWIRRNDTFVLLKDGDASEVKAELLASQIARCFDVRQVFYEPETYAGELVSSSEIISSIDYGLVSMEHAEIYAMNHDLSREYLIEKYDKYSFYMMNIIDYLVGNTDRHWGNWGFYVENRTNKFLRLYPLMDFNQSFKSYDSIEGSMCQTVSRPMSQKDAAIEAVKQVGLNQIKEVDLSLFDDEKTKEMFLKRLEILKSI